MLRPDDVTRHLFSTINRHVKPLVKRGLGSPLPIGAGFVVLETTGRRTGLTREVPLLAARLGDRITVTTARSASQWIRNVEADDAPAVWVAGRRRPATATVSRGPISVATLRAERV